MSSQLAISVIVPQAFNPDDYPLASPDETVQSVLREVDNGEDENQYRIEFRDGRERMVSFKELLDLDNGREALQAYEDAILREESEIETSEEDKSDRRRLRRTASWPSFVQDVSDDEVDGARPQRHPARSQRQRQNISKAAPISDRPTRGSVRFNTRTVDLTSSESGDGPRKRRRITRQTDPRNTRRSTRNTVQDPNLIYLVDEDDEDTSSEEECDLLRSDVVPPKSRRSLVDAYAGPKSRAGRTGMRQSARSTRHQQNMQEIEVGQIYRSDSDRSPAAPKAVGAREAFRPLPTKDKFRQRHCQQCDTCGKYGGGPTGQLVHCQGCTLSYHKHCLGNRNTREHLVTKVGEADFVLQCRRCINVARSKESTAPEQGMCHHCREIGPASKPFRKRRTPTQEEREREENDGEDPIAKVDKSLINEAKNVLFRCIGCWRAFHFHHLRSRAEYPSIDDDEDRMADERFMEYAADFACTDCLEVPAKPSGLVAWRPVDPDLYVAGAEVQNVDEDMKEYLVKFEDKSYYQCVWMPGAWVWGVTAPAMRKAFFKKVEEPTMNTEDAIPEDYLRIDIVLDVKYTSFVDTRAEEVDKARIREVDVALTKFKGLGYEDVVWEKVPTPEDGDRWTDFVQAYDNWVAGKYVKCPKASALKARLEKARGIDFPKLEKKAQPEKLVGGELMKYQLEGVNWLYYRWWLRTNAILADEMGLGKTIQIIGFLATMIHDHHYFPFLVVVPNGTVPNWRREIKQWAPSIRVVTYHGSSHARSLAHRYELFPNGAKELRCHVVVTSYEAAADDASRKLLRSVPWQGLIVDEGQRLKNDKTHLYDILSSLKIPFRLLLTGTPLQNNARELFNLLQFLDETFDATALELEYAELTKENVPQLHELIRPFFLRRTKAQVLTFLPPMAQIVLPVSMSSLQAKVYASILSKNTELIRVLYDTSKPMGKGERTSLNNILMQLRKCLCHPFVYSRDIEEITHEAAVSHRNLVEASAKLQLLEVLLPKLKERGHRVLIFSQFLGMLDIVEDFMDGLALEYHRLDGSMASMEKQKKIDALNAPESTLFAFLLSTRAGGVGINLATADTVIILDPDFNPHQDIQALSRAHRIGQKNKVLCFQLMTRASAEEKIVQIGRRKMALDHVLIEQMDNDDESGVDVESILRFGAADILEGKTQDIRYDANAVDKLLDRSQFEETKASGENTAESQFSYARVWANDTESLADSLGSGDEKEVAPDPSVWDKILKEREKQAAVEAAARKQLLGRGRRARQIVDYNIAEQLNSKDAGRHQSDSGSDTDFQEEDRKSDGTAADDEMEPITAAEIADVQRRAVPPAREPPKSSVVPVAQAARFAAPSRGTFQRVSIRWPGPRDMEADELSEPVQQCYVCGTVHFLGHCPLKLAGPEYCNMCGLAHFGVARSCPHIKSETQVRDMLVALRQSPESRHLIDLAKKYLTGVKGTLVQEKKRKAEKAAYETALKASQQASAHGPERALPGQQSYVPAPALQRFAGPTQNGGSHVAPTPTPTYYPSQPAGGQAQPGVDNVSQPASTAQITTATGGGGGQYSTFTF